MSTNKPVHTHNCDACVYLGTYQSLEDNAEKIDCYWCARKDNYQNLSSVLGRFGSKGDEYLSSHPFEAFAGTDDYLKHASSWYLFSLLQAVRMGLYVPTPLAPSSHG